MSALDHEPFPRGALIAAFALVGFSLVATTAARLGRIAAPAAQAPAIASVTAAADLRFADEKDGSIRVQDSATGRTIATVGPGSGGFIRGVMRGLARDRISRHIGPTPPFRLWQAADGHMSLMDSATGRVIDLESFGADNRSAFVNLLRAAEARS